MLFNAPIPRAPQPGFHEGSGMRSVRDADSVAVSWKKGKQTSFTASATSRAIAKLTQDVARLRRRIVGGGATSEVSGFSFGEYDPTKQYATGNVVVFTPDGGSAGAYVAVQAVKGVSPDTGQPNWVAWPNSPAGVWA